MTTNSTTKHRVDDASFQAACRACRTFFDAVPPPSSPKEKRPKDLLRYLIAICIEQGANTEKAIIGAIHSLGAYNPAEVATTLKGEAGLDRSVNRWFDGGDGTYVLHPNAFD